MPVPEIIQERYQQALHAEEPLAEFGINYFDEDTSSLVNKLQVDHNAIRTFLEQNGIEQKYFQQPYIHFVSKQTLASEKDAPFEPSHKASIYLDYVTTNDGFTYFPYIQLGIDPSKPSISRVNSHLRHELGHFVHGDNGLFYNKPGAVSLVRLLGMSAIAYNGVPPAPTINMQLIGYSAAAVGGAMASLMPHSLSHAVTPAEIRANHFARKHRSFNPIRLIN